MNCWEVRTLLGEYLEDTLTPAQRRTLQSHLFKCAPCRRELDDLAVLQQRISESLHLRVLMEEPRQGWARLKLDLLETARQRSLEKLRSWLPGPIGPMTTRFSRGAWSLNLDLADQSRPMQSLPMQSQPVENRPVEGQLSEIDQQLEAEPLKV